MTSADAGQPLVSVIIPCYQGARFIGQALASVAAQTYRPIEAVVVDDASTDDSAAVVESFNAPGVAVRLVRAERNRGIPATRNLALEHADGDLIAFLDQDDLWLPHKIERQVRALQDRDPRARGIVCSDIYVWNVADGDRGSLVLEERASEQLNEMDERSALSRLLECNFISSVTVLASRKAIDQAGGFDPDLTGGADDWDLWLRIAEKHPLIYVPEALAIYRVHENNYSALTRLHGDEERILEFWEERRPDLVDSIRRSRARMKYDEACQAFAAEDWRRAARQARSAVKTAPLATRFWPLLVKSTFKAILHGPSSPGTVAP